MTIKILLLNMRRRVYFLNKLRDELKMFKNEILYMDIDGFDPMVKYADKVIVYDKNCSNLVNVIFQVCIDYHVKLIIPWIDNDINLLSQHRSIFYSYGISIAIPSSNFVKISNDKFATFDWLAEKRIPQPFGFKLFKNLPHNQLCENFDFRKSSLIAKPRFGQGGVGVIKINNIKEYEIFVERLEQDYLLQKFISGDELTVDICWHKNEIYFCVPRLRMKVRGGEAMVSKIVKSDFSKMIGSQICRFFDEDLLFNFQVVCDEVNGFHVIEINPRFGGGSDLSIHAGANIPRALLKFFLNIGHLNKMVVKDGIVMSRFFQSEFFK